MQRKIVHPRILLLGAVTVVGISFLHYSRFNLQTDYAHYAWARALQGLGYAFFFVPLTMLAYSELRPDQNNRASSLTNFFRNWGGSFGIAFATTLAERRVNLHQSNVGTQLSASSANLQGAVQQTAAYLRTHGFSPADAMSAAYVRVYNQLQVQSQMLAFMDCFYVIGVLTLAAVPLLFFVRQFRVGGATGGH